MILEYNNKKYEVTDESIYRDFSINTYGLEAACTIAEEFANMSDYTFNLISYTGMIVVKRTITIANDTFSVGVRLREKTAEEKAVEELQTLRSNIAALASTASKTNAAKLNAILEKGENTDGNTTR